MRVVSIQEMREIEQKAAGEYGLSEELIIENYALRAAEYLYQNYLSGQKVEEVAVLVGRGNNGADALAVARHLRRFKLSLRAFCLFPEEDLANHCRDQIHKARAYGVKISEITDENALQSYFAQTGQSPLTIDGIFGTGVRLPVGQFFFDVFNTVNSYSSVIISVDIASGVNGDTGKVEGNAIHATETLAVGVPKLGHFIDQGAAYSGELKVIDGGLPGDLLAQGDKILLRPSIVQKLAKRRHPFAHKNDFGHCLVMGGSRGLCGALILASQSALAVGAGLVTATTWEENYAEVTGRMPPEIMIGSLARDREVFDKRLKFLDRYQSVVVGPGLGKSIETKEIVARILARFAGPVVLDADAINVLSFEKDRHLLEQRQFPTVLTPHLGEFSRFMGAAKEEVMANPVGWTQQFYQATGCSLLLKGACSFLAFPSDEIFINYSPNPGMATGGSGDVLAGILGGLFSQTQRQRKGDNYARQIKRFNAAVCFGVVLHSLSGRLAARDLGERAMKATSLIEKIPQAFFDLETEEQKLDYEDIVFEDLSY